MLALLFVGCGVFAPFDGTWLFSFERTADMSGDCAPEEDQDETYEYTGTNDAALDIYSTADGQLVILLGDALIGTVEGNAFEVSRETSQKSGKSEYDYEAVLDGALEGAVLSGDYEVTEDQITESDEYTCTSKTGYTAVKMTTSPDQLAGS